MNKAIVTILVVIVVAALAVFGFMAFRDDADNDDTALPEATTSQTTDPVTPNNSTDTGTDGNTENAGEVLSGQVEVSIESMEFQPETLRIERGSTVTWTNQDAVQHDITPDQVGTFFEQSQLLNEGESYSVVFSEPGTYTYHCSPHPHMTGTIVVE